MSGDEQPRFYFVQLMRSPRVVVGRGDEHRVTAILDFTPGAGAKRTLRELQGLWEVLVRASGLKWAENPQMHLVITDYPSDMNPIKWVPTEPT